MTSFESRESDEVAPRAGVLSSLPRKDFSDSANGEIARFTAGRRETSEGNARRGIFILIKECTKRRKRASGRRRPRASRARDGTSPDLTKLRTKLEPRALGSIHACVFEPKRNRRKRRSPCRSRRRVRFVTSDRAPRPSAASRLRPPLRVPAPLPPCTPQGPSPRASSRASRSQRSRARRSRTATPPTPSTAAPPAS